MKLSIRPHDRGPATPTPRSDSAAGRTRGIRLLSILAIGAVAFTVTACASQPTDEKPDAASITTINVGDLKIAGTTTAYAAKKLGYFTEHGLDVNFTYASSGNDLMSALESGSIDIGLAIPGTAITSVSKGGFDLVGVVQNEIAHEEGPDSGALMVLDDKDAPKSLSDLVGKRIGVVATGGAQDYLLVRETLRLAGVDPDDVIYQEIHFPQMASVLKQKQVDAVATVDPFTTFLKLDGAKALAWYKSQALPSGPQGVYWAKRSWAEKNESVATAYRESIVEAQKYLTEHPDEANKLITEFTELPAETVSAMTPIRWDSTVDVDKWDALIELYRKAGLIEKEVSPSTLLMPGAISG